MPTLIAVLVFVVLIVFGVGYVMDSAAHAKEAQATIEVAKVAQVQAVNNFLSTLVLAVLILVLVIILVAVIAFALKALARSNSRSRLKRGRELGRVLAQRQEPNGQILVTQSGSPWIEQATDDQQVYDVADDAEIEQLLELMKEDW